MANDYDNAVTMVRVTNYVERELDFKIGWVHLNRIEFGLCFLGFGITGLLGAAVYFPFGGFDAIVMVLSGIPGLPLAMTIVGAWKKDKPTSYMWDTFHRLGIPGYGDGDRKLARVKRGVRILVSDPRPTKSAFTGTRFEALARTEPFQELYGLPNWADRYENGTPRERILANESAIGTIVVYEWEEGEGPAPAYHSDCDPIKGIPKTPDDFVKPIMPMRLVKRVIPWTDL